MPDILHRVGIGANPERVYAALTTIDGLRHWWVVETTGRAELGGTIDFGSATCRSWRQCQTNLFIGAVPVVPTKSISEVTFRLEWKDDQTFVIFAHSGWKEPVEFMHHSALKWATFRPSLRDWLERMEGRPAPYDIKIHVRD